VAAGAGRPRRQLAVLAGCRHRLRQLPDRGLEPLADGGHAHPFASRADYDALVATLVATGSVREPTKLYWDVRPSTRLETLEFRVADVCMGVDEAVMVAGLVRALAFTCHDAVVRGGPDPRPRPELLSAAKWRASRHGLEADLVDVVGGRALPAAEMVRRVVDMVVTETAR
jgi:glutamate---cysteine ligase / carboxylate-amine ligase